MRATGIDLTAGYESLGKPVAGVLVVVAPVIAVLMGVPLRSGLASIAGGLAFVAAWAAGAWGLALTSSDRAQVTQVAWRVVRRGSTP